MGHYATYSPDDDKIRIFPAYRLDKETEYARVKSAGFQWAPKQECFYGVWTPDREDVALELCGEITDEDKTLQQRAEERAERFEDYSDNRAKEADQAHAAVKSIADGIPLGQPILVGHHSEKHARRDAAKIENGMRKAVNAWKTSEYWKQRAAGALQHALYKERPDVRARRIKTLEADLRKCIASYTPLVTKDRPQPMYIKQQAWGKCYPHGRTLTREEREAVPEELHVWTGPPGRGGTWTPVDDLPRIKAGCARYEEHLMHRLEYEHAMLEDQGAAVLLERKAKSPVAQLPLCNYRKPEGFEVENRYHRGEMIHYKQIEMTQAEYAKIYADCKGTRVVGNSHRIRTAVVVRAHVAVFITDSKIHTPPAPLDKIPVKVDPVAQAQAAVVRAARDGYRAEIQKTEPTREPAPEIEAMKETLKAGVQVVTANQLFPTPPELARRMCEAADIQKGQRILEPSAGTGNILSAIWEERGERCDVAIEINPDLCRSLVPRVPAAICADFLDAIADPTNLFDRILMNPPFENAADIKHVKHALTFLKPDGRLVAICANGPRQQEQLKPLADSWEELPAGTFAGTNVRAVLLTINKPTPKVYWQDPSGVLQESDGLTTQPVSTLTGEFTGRLF